MSESPRHAKPWPTETDPEALRSIVRQKGRLPLDRRTQEGYEAVVTAALVANMDLHGDNEGVARIKQQHTRILEAAPAAQVDLSHILKHPQSTPRHLASIAIAA